MGHAVLVYNPRAGRVLREPGIIGRIEGRAPAGVRRDPRDDDRGARRRGRDRPARDRCGRDDGSSSAEATARSTRPRRRSTSPACRSACFRAARRAFSPTS